MAVGGQRQAPAALSPGNTRYRLYRRLGGSHGWSGWARNISSPPTPPGFDPRTFQSVASRYTDSAIPAHKQYCRLSKISNPFIRKSAYIPYQIISTYQTRNYKLTY